MNTTWLSDIEKKSYPALDKDITADVVIIGAGMAGSLAAYLLSKEGKKVVLIDKGDIGSSMTAHTTAWITADLDTDMTDLVKMYGKEKVKAIFNSGNAAVDSFEKIINEEKIDCEFVRASVFAYGSNYDDTRTLEEEEKAAKDAGVEMALNHAVLPGFKNILSLEIPHQAKFHPLKFLNGIQDAAVRQGALIFNNTEATDINGNGPVVVRTRQGKITAEYSIMATYQPFKNPKELFGKKGMYKSYVFEVQIPSGLIKEGMYLDTHNPYHYFRLDPKEGHDRMILGGEDHRIEIPLSEEKNFRALSDFLQSLIPGVEYKIIHKWSGGILENVDGLPYIGRFSKNNERQLVATAFSGNGMHFSMIAGQVCRDIIMKKDNPDILLYNAGREVKAYNFFKKAMDFAGELFGGAVKNLFK